jgi:predicted transcriptional regulator
MKTNITLKLDQDLLRKARVLAAEKDTSVSALLAQQLERIIRQREGYDEAKKRALARLKRGYHLGYKPPASRDEFYER